MKVESRKRQFILDGKIEACFCEGCGRITEKVFVGEWMPSDKPKDDDLLSSSPQKKSKAGKGVSGEVLPAAENQYWIRCAECNQVYLLKEWQIQIDREVSPCELNPEECQVCSPHGIYAKGDALYHQSIGEVGVVREKLATGSGAYVIIVEFSKSGRKQLLENVRVNPVKEQSTESITDLIKMKLRR
ncbi:MAG: hypothetical protein FDX30_02365 [Chlorobium sp.]|nr:MAG: hypothetical protein FDX30_02365 [Chlorobium sp.]